MPDHPHPSWPAQMALPERHWFMTRLTGLDATLGDNDLDSIWRDTITDDL